MARNSKGISTRISPTVKAASSLRVELNSMGVTISKARYRVTACTFMLGIRRTREERKAIIVRMSTLVISKRIKWMESDCIIFKTGISITVRTCVASDMGMALIRTIEVDACTLVSGSIMSNRVMASMSSLMERSTQDRLRIPRNQGLGSRPTLVKI